MKNEGTKSTNMSEIIIYLAMFITTIEYNMMFIKNESLYFSLGYHLKLVISVCVCDDLTLLAPPWFEV